MINCKEASHRLSATLDTGLPMSERLGLKLHLMLCKWCSRYHKQLKFLQRAARQYHLGTAELSGDIRLTPEAAHRLNARIEQVIYEGGVGPGTKR